MKHVIDTLRKELKYHYRQLLDNENKIQLNKESIASLEQSNERHKQAISEIEQHVEELEAKELAK